VILCGSLCNKELRTNTEIHRVDTELDREILPKKVCFYSLYNQIPLLT